MMFVCMSELNRTMDFWPTSMEPIFLSFCTRVHYRWECNNEVFPFPGPYLIRGKLQVQKLAFHTGEKYCRKKSNMSDTGNNRVRIDLEQLSQKNRVRTMVTTTKLILRQTMLAKIQQKCSFNYMGVATVVKIRKLSNKSMPLKFLSYISCSLVTAVRFGRTFL